MFLKNSEQSFYVYRISDLGHDQARVPGITKRVCFENFCEVFRGSNIKIIADCCDASLDMISASGFNYVAVELGNSGSFKLALKEAIESDADYVYFVEDDYLHLPDSPAILRDGFTLSDYVTLYDHPDKYSVIYNFGEESKVMRTSLSHWRFTGSTCMTFGAKVAALRDDYSVWEECLREEIPQDHKAFRKLAERGRRLALSIPGQACHADLMVSGRLNQILLEPWCIERGISELEKKLADDQELVTKLTSHLRGWDKLKMLAAIKKAR